MSRPETVLTLEQAREAVADLDNIAGLIGIPVSRWPNNCHSISLRLLRTGRLGRGRIARGWAAAVRSQHSWIVLGDDVYDRNATIVDPTLRPLLASQAGPEDASLRKPILVASAWALTNKPHGSGYLQDRLPRQLAGEPVALTPATPLSRSAQEFLDRIGPLDKRAWMALANGPMQGWHAPEVIEAMMDTCGLGLLVPLDIRGMLTDRNPRGLYW
jgi:hypothetical protein